MKKKQLYLVLFIALFVASGISLFFAVGSDNITGLIFHEILDPAAAEAAAQAQNQAITENTATGPTLNSLKSNINTINQKITTLETDSSNTQQEVSRLSANIQSLSAQISTLQQKVDGEFNTLSTGLASVQKNVETTQTELTDIGSKINQGSSGKILIFVIIVLISGAGLFYYMTNIRGKKRLNPHIVNYITSHVKQGLKYPHIKSNLLSAGWADNDIEWAYKETVKNNYKQYKKKSYGKKKDPKSDKRKVAMISAGGLVLILIGIVFLRGGPSVGQAYQVYGGVDDYEEGTGLDRDITRAECFPPKVMIGGSCCEDRNANNVCDNQESYTEIDTSTLTGLITIGTADPTIGIQTKTIEMGSNGFSPQQLSIRAGDTIIFSNNRQKSARVIAGVGCPDFNNKLISPGETFNFQFVDTGSCQITVGVGSNNEACTDNNQCAGIRKCVDNQCKFISDLYQTSGCSESCTIIRSKLSTFHTNFPGGRAEQEYVLRMGLGSYAGAGALSWTILPMPDFCRPQNSEPTFRGQGAVSSTLKSAGVPIPFEIQEISNSNVLNTRVITIPSESESSISHRNIDLQGFTISVNEIHMTCGASVFS